MTEVVVTGAAGYLGSRVVAELRSAHPDWTVRGLDDFSRGEVRSVGDVDVAAVDVRNRDRLEACLAGADAVVHLAAVSGVEGCAADPDRAYEVNVLGTEHVAWFCRKTGTPLSASTSAAALGDPAEFPVTAATPRAPLNWYGRTKLLNERSVETLADGAVPAALLLKTNLYGDHAVDGRRVSKGGVIDRFVARALADEPLLVHEPGTQARNYVHVADAARAYVRSTERLLERARNGDAGAEGYAIGSRQDPSVAELADLVRAAAREELGRDPGQRVVENPRESETLVEAFPVDATRARDRLGWTPRERIRPSVRRSLRDRA